MNSSLSDVNDSRIAEDAVSYFPWCKGNIGVDVHLNCKSSIYRQSWVFITKPSRQDLNTLRNIIHHPDSTFNRKGLKSALKTKKKND